MARRSNSKRCPACGRGRGRNGAELLLMGANPASAKASAGTPGRRRKNPDLYDQFDTQERLTLGRAGIGRKDITNEADVREARRIISEVKTMKNRLPNPSLDSPAADQARQLREGFSGTPSEHYTVTDEPHVPAGDYTDCGEFIAVAVKPTAGGSASTVQEISFPDKDLELISNPAGDQLYIVGVGQDLTDSDVRIFTAETADRVLLGECRVISYGMVKYGHEVPVRARGEDVRWDHQFGEEGGTCPQIYYDRKMRRLILTRATYRIEGSWIRN